MSASVERVEFLRTHSLSESKHNPRRHNDKQVQRIADSIQRFGFLNPILADGTGVIIAGHGRWLAAQRLGLQDVPVIRVEHLSASERRAYVIADNRLAELSSWDKELLQVELEALAVELPKIVLDATGFSLEDTRAPTVRRRKKPTSPEDTCPSKCGRAVAWRGDVWLLGDHRLICADPIVAESTQTVLQGARADLALVDLTGREAHRSVLRSSKLLGEICLISARSSTAGSLNVIRTLWKSLPLALRGITEVYGELAQVCIWDKGVSETGAIYCSEHELFLFGRVARPSDEEATNSLSDRRGGDVWRYPAPDGIEVEQGEVLQRLPTALVEALLVEHTARNGVVLALSDGAGVTLVAAERARRVARVVEADPRKVDFAIRWFQAATGSEARLLSSGRTFLEEAEVRAANGTTGGKG
jgi:hypothetical protein